LNSLPRRLRGAFIALGLLLVALMLFGELFSIELSFVPSPPDYKLVVVVNAIMLGTVFAGTVVSWPLVSGLGVRARTGLALLAFLFTLYGARDLTNGATSVYLTDFSSQLACVGEAINQASQDRESRLDAALRTPRTTERNSPR
jgi:hypothetical protein